MIVTLLVYLVFGMRIAYASFTEDFNGNYSNPAVWETRSNFGQVVFSSTHLQLLNSSYSSTFPYVRTITPIFQSSGAFTTRFSFRYFSSGAFGDGIVLTQNPPEYGTAPEPHKDFILFVIWQDIGGGLRLFTTTCPTNNQGCNHSLIQIYSFGKNDFSTHLIEINYDENGSYAVYVDGSSGPIYTSAGGQVRPVGYWLGHPQIISTDSFWNPFEIDYIDIDDLPTPTPTPEPLRPVVIIPGMFGSVDFGPLLRDEQGNNWHVPPYVTFYDNLIRSLKNVGYEEGANLFVFAYDWRKPLSTLGVALKDYIDGLVSTGKIGAVDKIDFIGHSYGGLVGRTYAQSNVDKVNKLLMAGSPNQGDINAYGAWEGGEAWGKWWQKILLWLSVQRLKLPGETRVATVRRISPSIKDVLPTFNYLEQNGGIKPVVLMSQRNNFLPYLDGFFDGIDGLSRAIGGTGELTKERVRVEDRQPEDRLLGKWEDGKPIRNDPFRLTDRGDEAVLLNSAWGPFGNKFSVNADHGEVIAGRSALEKIFEELGLDKTKITTVALDTRESSLAIGLRSPGTLNVCDSQNICNENLGIYYPDGEKLFILPGYDNQDLNVTVAANGETGDYILETGLVDESDPIWREMPGNLASPTEVDSFTLDQLIETPNYTVIGLNKPISIENKIFKNGRTIPIKFQLKDPLGRYISTAIARLYVNGTEAVASGFSNKGNYFRYDYSSDQYLYNLSTKNFLLPAINTLEVVINGTDIYTATIVMN